MSSSADKEPMAERMRQLYLDHFGKSGVGRLTIARAPGRIEVLGNHTDYNRGLTLSAAVDKYIWVAFAPVEKGKKETCVIYDENLKDEKSFSLGAIPPAEAGDWSGYIKGVVQALQRRQVKVPVFQGVVYGDVPMSAGMSSSAAFEMAVSLALNELAGANLDAKTLARVGQEAENRYIGAHTGLLDQYSSLFGVAGALVECDFRDDAVKSIPLSSDYVFVVINSMVKHVLTGAYNDRRKSCEQAVRCLSRRPCRGATPIYSLRDATIPQLLQARKRIPEHVFDCAAHVMGEIERVRQADLWLAQGKLEEFGQLLFQSHESSRFFFDNSCAELDLLIDLAKEYQQAHPDQVFGARLSGGGFGGISIHLVRADVAENYGKELARLYKKNSGIAPQYFICRTADGATLLK